MKHVIRKIPVSKDSESVLEYVIVYLSGKSGEKLSIELRRRFNVDGKTSLIRTINALHFSGSHVEKFLDIMKEIMEVRENVSD